MKMKKISDFLKNMLLTVVYPNRILTLFRVKNLDKNSNKILGNDTVVRILALTLAIVFVIYVRYTPVTSIEYQRTISVPLSVFLDDEAYTLLGNTIPLHVDVILSGDQTSIELLMGSAGISAHVDLTRFGHGVYEDVLIEVVGAGQQVTARPNPSAIEEVEIARIEEMQFPVYLSAGHLVVDEALRYKIGDITFYPEYVYVRGPQVLLDEIFRIQAILDVANISLTAARTEVFEESLVAIRRDIESIRGISVYPSIVHIEVEIYEDLRTIRLDLNRNLSDVPTTVRITNVTAEIAQIEVWGNFANMEDVIGLQQVSFADLNDDGQVILEVSLPSGVYTEQDGAIVTIVEVVVTVEFEEIPQLDPLLDEDTES